MPTTYYIFGRKCLQKTDFLLFGPSRRLRSIPRRHIGFTLPTTNRRPGTSASKKPTFSATTPRHRSATLVGSFDFFFGVPLSRPCDTLFQSRADGLAPPTWHDVARLGVFPPPWAIPGANPMNDATPYEGTYTVVAPPGCGWHFDATTSCDREAVCKGLCKKHDQQKRKGGIR